MTTQTGYALLLAAVVINSDNDTIRLDEAGVIASAVIAHGTYYLRGDGDTADLAAAIATALGAAFAGGNTYSVLISGSINASSRCLTVTITRVGGATNFRVKWSDGSATFGKEILGFVNTKAAADGADEVSTKTPNCGWISNDMYRERRRVRTWSVGEDETEDGDTSIVRRGSKAKGMVVELRFVSGLRLLEEDTTAALDTDTLEHFIDVNNDGRPIEVHEVTPTAGSTAIPQPIAILLSTFDGRVVLGVDAGHIDARRIDPGVALYDYDLILKGSTA